MSTSQKSRDEPQVPPKSTSTVILLTVADTTWRMFVPSVGLTLLGLWLDGKLHTSPWALLIGVVLGLFLAVKSVKMQLKKISDL